MSHIYDKETKLWSKAVTIVGGGSGGGGGNYDQEIEDLQNQINQIPDMPKIVTSETEPSNPEEGLIWFRPKVKEDDIPVPDYFFRFDAMELGLADNAKVASWQDLSGNGFDLTQAIADDQPVYLESGINGKPAVQFNDSLLENNAFQLGTDEFTLFVVAEVDEASTTILAILDVDNQDYRLQARVPSNGSEFRVDLGGGGTYAPLTLSSAALYSVTYDSSSLNMYAGGEFVRTSSATGGIGTHNTLGIGRRPRAHTTLPLVGRVSEVICFSRVL